MKRLTVGLLLVFGLFGAIILSISGSAKAYTGRDYCSRGAYNSNYLCRGFFTSGTSDGVGAVAHNLVTGGLHESNAADFENDVHGYLYGGNGQNNMGAAMLIAVMLGHGPFGSRSGGIGWAKDHYSDWKTLVEAYANSTDNSYGIKWYAQRNVSTNSAYFSDMNDDAFHKDEHGVAIYVIEFFWPSGTFDIEKACGNLTNASPPPFPPAPAHWTMNADSSVQAIAAKGQTVTFKHVVWNSGADKSDTINGEVRWTAATTGPVPSTAKQSGGYPVGVKPAKTYSQKFAASQSKSSPGKTLTFSFTIPSTARVGDKYCQHVTFDPTSWKDSSQGKSDPPACVTVSATIPPPSGTETVTCSFYLTHTGTWEVSSRSFAADYTAQVKTTRRPTSTTSGWSGWSGFSGSGEYISRTRTRTATVVTYKVEPASFTSTWDGSNNPSSRTQSAAGGNLSTPVPPPSTPSASPNTVNTSSNFPYTWEDNAGHYTADGTFTYTVVKVTTVYKQTETDTWKGTYYRAYYTYTYDSSGNRISHYHPARWGAPYSHSSYSYSGWPVQSTANANVASDTVDCDPVSAGQDQITFAYRPYLQVSGGDVLAGAYQKSVDDASCTSTAAGIYGWNHNNGNGSPDDSVSAYYHDSPLRGYGGAGTDAAAFALANIKYFSSAQHTTGGLAPAPTGLSFSNAGTNPNAGLYGTNFGNLPTNCNFVPEFTGNLAGGFPAGGNSSYSGNHTYVVHGDVTISGDIIYANSGGWSSPTDIPQLKLVVIGGNITIDGSVAELDGVYIATGANKYQCNAGDTLVAPWGKTCQHRNADGSIDSYQGTIASTETGGEIFTCQSTDYDTCNNQLTVYGSLVADKIHFRRTSGTLNAPGGTPAEHFIYSPEAWIPNQAGRTTLDYDSIVGLPPVL